MKTEHLDVPFELDRWAQRAHAEGGVSVSDIARHYGCSRQYASSLVLDAVAKVRERLAELDSEPTPCNACGEYVTPGEWADDVEFCASCWRWALLSTWLEEIG